MRYDVLIHQSRLRERYEEFGHLSDDELSAMGRDDLCGLLYHEYRFYNWISLKQAANDNDPEEAGPHRPDDPDEEEEGVGYVEGDIDGCELVCSWLVGFSPAAEHSIRSGGKF